MGDLVLDPDDGRDTGLNLPRPRFADHTSDLPAPPGMAEFSIVIQRMVDNYRRKVIERAEELARCGLGLGEVAYETVADDDPNVMRIRGTFRIVPLHPDGGPND